MTPDEVKRLTKMIKESTGRLSDSTCETIAFYLWNFGVVVPPCRLYDTVYILLEGGEIGEYQAQCVHEFDGKGIIRVGYKGFFGILKQLDCEYSEWNNVIFPTREEAEKALKECDAE